MKRTKIIDNPQNALKERMKFGTAKSLCPFCVQSNAFRFHGGMYECSFTDSPLKTNMEDTRYGNRLLAKYPCYSYAWLDCPYMLALHAKTPDTGVFGKNDLDLALTFPTEKTKAAIKDLTIGRPSIDGSRISEWKL